MTDLVKFSELLAESQATDFRTQETITEADNSLRTQIDSVFISVPKLTVKILIDMAYQYNSKTTVTTDGEYAARTIKNQQNITYRIDSTKNFYKSGTSEVYIAYGDSIKVMDLIKEAFEATDGSIQKVFDYMLKNYKEKGVAEVRIESDSNKIYQKINPYVLLKNIKPYAKPLPEDDKPNSDKIRVDDIVKMVVNGQIASIVTDFHYTDDHVYDAYVSGQGDKRVNQINFLIDYIRSSKPYSYFDKTGGHTTIGVIFHSNHSVTLIPDRKKFKK